MALALFAGMRDREQIAVFSHQAVNQWPYHGSTWKIHDGHHWIKHGQHTAQAAEGKKTIKCFPIRTGKLHFF